MEEIRNLLSQGKSSSEVIALGYKPPTVYKVQRQLRKKGHHTPITSELQNEPLPVATTEAEGDAKKAGPPSLQEWLKRHGWVDKRADSTTSPRQSETSEGQHQLKSTGKQPAEASEVKALQDQVRSLQVEAQAWQRRADEAQKTLKEAERHLWEAHWVIDDLTPLMVWAGHPCCVCGEPTDGVVDQETAAKLIERTGHKECLIQAGLRRRRHSFDLMGGAKIRRATVMADTSKHPNGILIVP